MSGLTVWSLNGERFVGKTPDEEPQTMRWLAGLAGPGATVPDVLCLQDVRVSVMERLGPLGYHCFAPMTNHMVWGERELLGIAIASRWPIDEVAIATTSGDGVVRDLLGVDMANRRIQPLELSDKLVLETENRVVMACTVHKPGESALRIATHHGYWTRDGLPTEGQMRSTDVLCDFLVEQGRRYGGVVYTADYNPDREGRVLAKYMASGGIDFLPREIRTTLAAHHPAARYGVRSDCFMVWPNEDGEYPYVVPDVHLCSAPGSDHEMLCGHVLEA